MPSANRAFSAEVEFPPSGFVASVRPRGCGAARSGQATSAPTSNSSGGASHSSSRVASRSRGLQQHELAVARDQKIEHLRSLSPAFSRSRTRIRRSRASGASESSIDWFWQTMQRSSRTARAPAPPARGRAAPRRAAPRAPACSGSKASNRTQRAAARSATHHALTPPAAARPCRAPAWARRRAAAGRTARARRRHHHHRAEPDQQHQRLVIEPHRDARRRIGVAEREIELARSRASCSAASVVACCRAR